MIYSFALLALAVLPTGSVAPEAPGPQINTPAAQVSGFAELRKLAQRRLEAAGPAPAQQGAISVGIDERIELFTIIFRLAGIDEFSGDHFKAYSAAVDARFAPHAQHPAVGFARRMREEVGVSSDGVAALAATVSPLPDLQPPETFEGTAVDGKWRFADAREFTELARDFARESNFSEFFNQGRPVYELVSLRMRKLVEREITEDWFSSYFRQPPSARMHVAPALLNGHISFGFTAAGPGGPATQYAVMGTWLFDDDGLPVYDERIVPTIVHEFCHSYVDPAVSRRGADFKAAADALQPALAEHLPRMRQFYWRTLFEESLVRGVVARYLLEHKGEEAARAELALQARNGFVWIEGVYELLEEYERNRERYPTFEHFLPRAVEFFTELPARLPEIVDVAGRQAHNESGQ